MPVCKCHLNAIRRLSEATSKRPIPSGLLCVITHILTDRHMGGFEGWRMSVWPGGLPVWMEGTEQKSLRGTVVVFSLLLVFNSDYIAE